MNAVVTTPRRPSAADVEAARAEAARLGHPYAPRGSTNLERLAAGHGAAVLLVADARSRALWLPGMRHVWRFHGGMAVLRIRRLVAGGADEPFLRACALRPGDVFLDATGGAGADALVAAHAVGEGGRAIVVEASRLLHAVIDHGVRHVRFGEAAVDAALDRMEVVAGDHLEVLRRMPDASVDVIYFDPMFREPAKAPPGFDVIRALADPRPLAAEAIEEAKRVARRRIVIQDRPRSGELERLGARELPLMGRYAPVRFGAIDPK